MSTYQTLLGPTSSFVHTESMVNTAAVWLVKPSWPITRHHTIH